MNSKSRLLHIFGPLICAFVLLELVLLYPWTTNIKSEQLLYKASVSCSKNIFKGQEIKQAAFSKEYVPFYGSSELLRMDCCHPSVLAYKYKRDYKPFLLGGPGSQSLTQFFNMQETVQQLQNKKAVYIISPQWFTKQGQNPNAFGLYFSQLQLVNWLLSAKDSIATRYVARRLLSMPKVAINSNVITNYALMMIAAGKKLTPEQLLWFRIRRRMLLNEDNFFTSMFCDDNVDHIKKVSEKLPDKYDPDKLHEVATLEGKLNTNNNSFGIANQFYTKRLNNANLQRLKGAQKAFNYTKSPEYSDLQLVLSEFAKEHVNVLFVIPPVNKKWSDYTGLSSKMYQKTVAKIKQQLISQGFYNIADLSRDGGKPYFMEDTIHLGWNGWLEVDKYVRPLMKQCNIPISYNLKNYYFSKTWANKVNIKHTTKQLTPKKQAQLHIKQALDNAKVRGNVLVIKNNKPFLNYQNSYADYDMKKETLPNSSYLINSTQKVMTAVMLMKQVEKGRLSLSDKLSKFYPQVPFADKISISQLLSMTSGLATRPRAILGTSTFKSNQAGIRYDIKKNIILSPKLYNKRYYDSFNYVLISGILEKITHKTYEQLFTATYIKPLALKHTAFAWSKPAKMLEIGAVNSYQSLDNVSNPLVKVNIDINQLHGLVGAGNIYMSNADLYKTIRYILQGKIISNQSIKELFNKVNNKNDGSNYMGGFYNFVSFKSCNGYGYGFSNFVRISKDGSNAIIVQTNMPIKRFFALRATMNKLILGLSN